MVRGLLNFLLKIINMLPINPATSKPMSSAIPSFNAAVNPTIDQINGMPIIYAGILFYAKSKIPNVKIVVGQGKPKVGFLGYVCPNATPRIG